MNSLVWFRMDLRLLDNPAFYNALKLNRPTYALYILSPKDFKAHDRSNIQIDFMLRQLSQLSKQLYKELKIPLLIRILENGRKPQNWYQVIKEVVDRYQIGNIFWNTEYEVDEQARDSFVEQQLKEMNVEVHSYHEQVIVEPGILKSQQGRVYTVYSPFRNAWFELVRNNRQKYLTLYDYTELPKYKQTVNIEPDAVPESLAGFELTNEKRLLMKELYQESEKVAHEKLNQFALDRIRDYKSERDIPSINGTSQLSPYLAIGILSAKQCLVKAVTTNNNKIDTGSEGCIVWIQELIWRDFYKHILLAFPRVCKRRPFKADTENIPWQYDQDLFEKWCQGKTGYPLVDAGMRQLNETGWMHNRVRMVTASFLSKHLLHNWMLGEKYFKENLIDGDFSANNGGWQWAASTGTDSQPYFRVFNPLLQSKRFDPEGKYIKKWVKELSKVSSKDIHDPEKGLGLKKLKELGYVGKCVEHESARKRAIEVFKMSAQQFKEGIHTDAAYATTPAAVEKRPAESNENDNSNGKKKKQKKVSDYLLSK